MQEAFIIRHAQPNGQLQSFFIGRENPELSPRGLERAAALIKNLSININDTPVFCSPLNRAYQTAQIAFGRERGNIMVANELIEQDFGILEGISTDMANRLYPEAMQYLSTHPSDFSIVQGESYRDMLHRAEQFMKTISGKNRVVIVSHLYFITALVQVITGKQEPVTLGYCDVLKLSMNGSSWTITPVTCDGD